MEMRQSNPRGEKRVSPARAVGAALRARIHAVRGGAFALGLGLIAATLVFALPVPASFPPSFKSLVEDIHSTRVAMTATMAHSIELETHWSAAYIEARALKEAEEHKEEPKWVTSNSGSISSEVNG